MRTQLSKQTQREQDIYDIFQVIGHVNNNSHTVNVNWNSEEYSVKILWAIIDRVRLGIP